MVPTSPWRSRLAAVAVLGVAVVGFLGGPTQLTNPIAALVTGAGLTVLVLVAATGSAVWDRWNPFAAAGAAGRAPTTIDPRWTVAVTALGAGWLHLNPAASDPDRLAVFVVVWLAGSLVASALTGGAWARDGEPLTLTLRWIRGLRSRDPDLPDLAATVLALDLALALAAAARATGALPIGPGVGDEAVAAVTAGAVAVLLRRTYVEQERVGALATVFVGGIVATGMVGNRFTTSLQVLVVEASDPLRRGADLLGTADLDVDPSLPSTLWRTVLQVTVMLAAAVVAGHRWPADRRRLLASDVALTALVLLVTVP